MHYISIEAHSRVYEKSEHFPAFERNKGNLHGSFITTRDLLYSTFLVFRLIRTIRFTVYHFMTTNLQRRLRH